MKQNFIRCGLTGIFIEIFFTGMGSLLAHDYTLMGHSSVLMFPIYGSAAFIEPLLRRYRHKHFLVRGVIYTICIYIVEYTSGLLLRILHICPWDYSNAPANLSGLIRFDFAPFWFITGLIFERLLLSDDVKAKPLSSQEAYRKYHTSHAPVNEHSKPDSDRTCL